MKKVLTLKNGFFQLWLWGEKKTTKCKTNTKTIYIFTIFFQVLCLRAGSSQPDSLSRLSVHPGHSSDRDLSRTLCTNVHSWLRDELILGVKGHCGLMMASLVTRSKPPTVGLDQQMVSSKDQGRCDQHSIQKVRSGIFVKSGTNLILEVKGHCDLTHCVVAISSCLTTVPSLYT